MAIMTPAKFHFNRLMLTLIFGIRASEPPPPGLGTTEKAGPDRVKNEESRTFVLYPYGDNFVATQVA